MEQLERRRIGPLEVFKDDAKWLLRGELAEQLRKIPLQSGLELRGIRVCRYTIPIAGRTESREEVRQLRDTSPSEQS